VRIIKSKLIHWLVIVVMILQPIAFSSAMASMEHAQTKSVGLSDMQQPADMASSNCRMSLADKSSNVDGFDNCCSAATCYFAYLSEHFFQTPVLSHFVIAIPTYSFANVDVSVQTRPPKHLPV